jgi:hypothetical protein
VATHSVCLLKGPNLLKALEREIIRTQASAIEPRLATFIGVEGDRPDSSESRMVGERARTAQFWERMAKSTSKSRNITIANSLAPCDCRNRYRLWFTPDGTFQLWNIAGKCGKGELAEKRSRCRRMEIS